MQREGRGEKKNVQSRKSDIRRGCTRQHSYFFFTVYKNQSLSEIWQKEWIKVMMPLLSCGKILWLSILGTNFKQKAVKIRVFLESLPKKKKLSTMTDWSILASSYLSWKVNVDHFKGIIAIEVGKFSVYFTEQIRVYLLNRYFIVFKTKKGTWHFVATWKKHKA